MTLSTLHIPQAELGFLILLSKQGLDVQAGFGLAWLHAWVRDWQIIPSSPCGLVYSYQLDVSISNFRGVWGIVFNFILFQIEIPVSKQCRLWSNAMFCVVWSGSALFAKDPKMGC